VSGVAVLSGVAVRVEKGGAAAAAAEE
jgi:hypothetical protein